MTSERIAAFQCVPAMTAGRTRDALGTHSGTHHASGKKRPDALGTHSGRTRDALSAKNALARPRIPIGCGRDARAPKRPGVVS